MVGMRLLTWLAIITLALLLPVGCEVWKYGECRKVGHGRLYCLAGVGQ